MGKISKSTSNSANFTNIDWTLGTNGLIAIYGSNPQLIIEAAKLDKHFLIDEFSAAGMDINFRDPKGNTALHHAAKNLSFSSIWKLISLGADTTIKSSKGNLAESSLKYSFYKGASSKKEQNELAVKNCKILFKIAKYAEFIINPESGVKVSFSKGDHVVAQDIKFLTLAIRKLWNKIEDEGITDSGFLDGISRRVDEFVSKMKISPHSAFTNSFKDHMQREWDARTDKLKEAQELLASFKIDSILSLEPSQIEDIVHLMITNPDLEHGFKLLQQSPITTQEREIVEQVMEKFGEISPTDKIVSLIRTANSNSYNELTAELSLEQKCEFYANALHDIEEAASDNMYINILVQKTLKGFREKLEETDIAYHQKLYGHVSTKLQSILDLIEDSEHTSIEFLKHASENLDSILPMLRMEDTEIELAGDAAS